MNNNINKTHMVKLDRKYAFNCNDIKNDIKFE